MLGQYRGIANVTSTHKADLLETASIMVSRSSACSGSARLSDSISNPEKRATTCRAVGASHGHFKCKLFRAALAAVAQLSETTRRSQRVPQQRATSNLCSSNNSDS